MPQPLTTPLPGTTVPMSEKEFKDYQSQLAMQATTKMVVPTKPSAEEFAKDFDTYIAIQKAIDERMKDSVMDIQGKPFRKKAYWRAVATAFRLSVKKVSDEYFKHGEDWGYHATWVAVTENGRQVEGEGSFQASEKARRDGSMVDATHHNIRATANTRAFNRAVSNCVGFGEVSAEEMPMDRLSSTPGRAAGAASRPPQASSGPWDGELPVTFGKFKPGGAQGGESGKQWKDIPQDYLDWILSDKCSIATAKDMAGKELGRRAKVEAAGGGTVDAEEIPLPLDTPPGVEDPRLWDKDDDGYSP